jgi:hypothetical protein
MTPGSGGYGFSFEESLYDVIPGRTLGGFPAT